MGRAIMREEPPDQQARLKLRRPRSSIAGIPIVSSYVEALERVASKKAGYGLTASFPAEAP